MTQSFKLDGTEFAIIGMAGRVADAPDLGAFWTLLRSGASAVKEHPRDDEETDWVPYAARLGSAFDFDNLFFDIGTSEALAMDPQQRHLLEIGQLALADGGYDNSEGRPICGVFAGVSTNTYNAALQRLAGAGGEIGIDARDMTGLLGSEKDFSAARLAYKLGLEGPCLNVQTACSTGLSLVHVACQSMMAGDCGMALVGAAGIRHVVNEGYAWQSGGIYSRSGRCAAFDASADGCVPGNGVFAILLRPLEQAIADRDPIRAVIRGSAINNDGRRKAGFAAPSCDGQIEVIGAALAAADLEPAEIDFYETHGTGTPLGDPIEYAALRDVFAGSRETPLKLGTLKPVIGHLDAAAGLAALAKSVLCLQKHFVPAMVNFEDPNPELGSIDEIELTRRPHVLPLDRASNAAVTALGVGGTNATIVVSGWDQPALLPATASTRLCAIVLSAPCPDRLRKLAGKLARDIAARPTLDLRDISGTLAWGRTHRAARQAWLIETHDQLLRQLRAFAGPESDGGDNVALPLGLRAWMDGGAPDFDGLVPAPGDFQRLSLSADAYIPTRFNLLDKAKTPQTRTKPNAAARGQPDQATEAVGFIRHAWQEIHPVKLRSLGSDATIVLHTNKQRGSKMAQAHKEAGASVCLSLPLTASDVEIQEALAECGASESVRIVIHTNDDPSPRGPLGAWIKASEDSAVHQAIAVLQSVLKFKKAAQLAHVVLVTTNRNRSGQGVNPLSWAAEGLFAILPTETSLVASQLDVMDLHPTHDRRVVDVVRRIGPGDALRLGPNRLEKRFVDRIVDETALTGQVLNPKGPILVLGGTGGIGKEIVQRLAKDAPQTRVIALGSKSPLSLAFADWTNAIETVSRISRDALGKDDPTLISDDPVVVSELEAYCAWGISSFWAEAGFGHGGAPFSRADFLSKAGILPEFERMIDFQITFMRDKELVREATAGTFVWQRRPPNQQEAAGMRQTITQRFPDLESVIALLDRCFECYRAALSGEIASISALYPGGSEHLMEASARAMLPRSYGRSLCRTLGDWIAGLATQSDVPFRVLEVGSGNGLLTSELARAARECGKIEIHATDIGRNLVKAGAARAKRKNWKRVTFGVLDITQPGSVQGIEPGSYDLVCGLNVIHAVPQVATALQELRRSVKPGGMLAMVESVVREPWVDCVAGLADGWWSYSDGREHNPLLSAVQWRQRLTDAGFQDAASVFDGDTRADCDLIFARAPQDVETETVAGVFGPDTAATTTLMRADLRDPADVRRTVRQVQERFGKVQTLVHCSGRIAGALLANLSRTEIDVEFGARVHGLANVLDEIDLTELQEVILSSSMNYFRGGEGQVAYVAANATVAGIGAWLESCHAIKTTVIHWDRWQGVGLGKAFEARYAAFSRAGLQPGIDAEVALNALAFVRTNQLTDAGIARLDHADKAPLSAVWEQSVFEPMASGVNDLEAFVDICREVLGRPGLDASSRLVDAGVDSLDILELQDALSTKHGVEFQIGALMSETLGALATIMNGTQPSGPSFVRKEPTRGRETLDLDVSA